MILTDEHLTNYELEARILVAGAHRAANAMDYMRAEIQRLQAENTELRAKLDAVPVMAINTVVHAAVHAYDMRGDRADVTAVTSWLRQRAVQP
jgi:hypothetical protein